MSGRTQQDCFPEGPGVPNVAESSESPFLVPAFRYGKSQARSPRGRRHHKPAVIQVPILAGILALTLGLVALVEYACQSLPHNVFNVRHKSSSLGGQSTFANLTGTPPGSGISAVPSPKPRRSDPMSKSGTTDPPEHSISSLVPAAQKGLARAAFNPPEFANPSLYLKLSFHSTVESTVPRTSARSSSAVKVPQTAPLATPATQNPPTPLQRPSNTPTDPSVSRPRTTDPPEHSSSSSVPTAQQFSTELTVGGLLVSAAVPASASAAAYLDLSIQSTVELPQTAPLTTPAIQNPPTSLERPSDAPADLSMSRPRTTNSPEYSSSSPVPTTQQFSTGFTPPLPVGGPASESPHSASAAAYLDLSIQSTVESPQTAPLATPATQNPPTSLERPSDTSADLPMSRPRTTSSPEYSSPSPVPTTQQFSTGFTPPLPEVGPASASASAAAPKPSLSSGIMSVATSATAYPGLSTHITVESFQKAPLATQATQNPTTSLQRPPNTSTNPSTVTSSVRASVEEVSTTSGVATSRLNTTVDSSGAPIPSDLSASLFPCTFCTRTGAAVLFGIGGAPDIYIESGLPPSIISIDGTPVPVLQTTTTMYINPHLSKLTIYSTAISYPNVGSNPTSSYAGRSSPALMQPEATATFSLPSSANTSIITPTTTETAGDPGTILVTYVVVLSLPAYKYFIGAYLPTIIAVTYRIVWTAVYATAKLMEPFCQLAEPDGASAEDALLNCYVSSNLSLDLIVGFHRGRWAMLGTSIAYAVVGFLVPPLAAETLFVDRNACGEGNKCLPRLNVSRSSGRMLEGLLCFVALIIIAIIFLQWKRKTGVYGDPSSIATIASLMHHPEVLGDFRRLDSKASEGELKNHLRGKRYRLAQYRASGGAVQYGFVPAHDGSDQTPDSPIPSVSGLEARPNRRALLILIRDIAFCLVMAGTLGLVVAYYREAGDTGFNRFMNGGTFGPRFMMTFIGGLIDSHWKRIEREVRAMNPYRRLARGHAKPNDTIFVKFTSTPFTTFPASLWRKDFFLAFISFIALLSEILIIMLSGVPFSSSQVYEAFLVSSYISMIILGLMILAVLALLFWRMQPELPRMPNTVANVMSYLCASHMLKDLEVLSTDGNDTLTKCNGGSYVYKRLRGTDMVRRWAVDKDHNPGAV